MFSVSPTEVTQLIEDKIIEIAPLGYMRGRTFKNTWVVADEMQNSIPTQMKMLLTRLGEGPVWLLQETWINMIVMVK